MYCGVYAPWDHVPKFLRYSEVINPLVPVQYFFDANDIEGHEKNLKRWRYHVVNDGYFNDERFGPGHLIYDYELNIRLVEALSLLLLDHDDSTYAKKVPEEQLTVEKEEWIWFPTELSRKELLDPYVAIKAAFEDFNLQQFRDHLAEWLSTALSVNAVDEYISAGEIIMVYDHLKKMYSAAWLIFQRDTERTQYNDRTKKAQAEKNSAGSQQNDLDKDAIKGAEVENSNNA